MLFGLEKEFFVIDSNNNLCIVPKGLSYDECGILAEARGNPKENIISAVYSLKESIYRLSLNVKKYDVSLLNSPLQKVSRKLKLGAQRLYAKGLISYQNIYGYENHRNSSSEHTAGIHISITFPLTKFTTITVKNKSYTEKVPYNSLWDFVQFIRYMDSHFEDEIKESKRRPGFYEIKPDGRIEYRSLPSTADLNKIIDVVTSYNFYKI